MLDLLKFITCGSVDDGKSTLIGHMLYDAKLLFADQKKTLELDSKVGSRDGRLDYSLLLDGLMAEREQGITIDAAYRYFSTQKRSFIVADTPGHEEYTRNMAVGASFAQLAVILVDASQGVLSQTKRHMRICSLMGIKHFVFALNKMDLVGYDEHVYDKIKKQIKLFIGEFEYESLMVIPVSATEGDNITEKSPRMLWYKQKPLLNYLEEIDTSKKNLQKGFLMSVQRVCRPNHTFRGFQGCVARGRVKIGDEITVLPSLEKANITSILVAGEKKDICLEGQAVTLQLNREIDISRGDIFVKDYRPKVSNMFNSIILWMDETRLVQGRNYYIRLATKLLPATIMDIKYKVDVNTGEQLVTDSLCKNEIGSCDISLAEKIAIDSFGQEQQLGCFILIDRITNMTTACGVIENTLRRSDNLSWEKQDVTSKMRKERMGQTPLTLWFTGLSGAGKSTLANCLEKRLYEQGKYTMLLDGDNIRMGLNRNLGFKENDRIENIRRIAEVSKLMNDAGLIVLTAFISPYIRDRENAREIIGKNFIEIYVNTSLEICEKRDAKGLYKKAKEGYIPNFTGISAPYEPPRNPEIIVDTADMDIDQCVDFILEKLKKILGGG